MEEWISTLKLSTMWDFTALRELAIRNLVNKLDPIEMILLGSQYRISQWFIGGCTTLIRRHQGLKEEEGDRLGMRLTVQICGIRERMIHHAHANRSTIPFDYQRAVREAFPDKIVDHADDGLTT